MGTPNLAVMPSPTLSENRQLDQHIRSAIRQHNVSFMHVAYYGWRLKLNNGFTELGYADEYAYMMSLGVSRSWWFEALAVGQALNSLPLEEIEKIPIGQAQLLLQIKPEVRTQYPWAKEAQQDSFRDLAKKIEARNALIPGPEKIPTTPITFRVAATAKEAICKNLESFREKHDLASIGQALEFAVADKTQDTNILAGLYEALKLMSGVRFALNKRSMAEERQWLDLATERVREAYKTLLQASREDGDAVYEEAIHETEDATGDEEDLGWPGVDAE